MTSRYEYYQSLTHMTVACLARDADATRSTSSTALAPEGHSTLSVSLGLPAGAEFSLELDLYDAAVPGIAILSVRAPRTEVRFEKAASARYMWPQLERVAGSIAPLPPQPAAAAGSITAPVVKGSSSSGGGGGGGGGGGPTVTDEAAAGSVSGGGSGAAKAKSKTKDWNKLEKELKEEEAAAAGEGEEALMKLFRNIYTGADENTRRAMVKSFQTSGGTVLSTNWGEVAKEDYEKNLKPPEGMEFVKEK